MSDERPDPDALLLRAREEEARAVRGRLKIFFGAAPGVGKTYAMLEEARARKKDGVDVVIGWLEPHGRRETEALAAGLERVPPRVAVHRGIEIREMDLDAVLRRRPQLVLVDELAHTDAPGGRHEKRWQDVEEILDAGVDVASTLNVQHVESLNDVVAQITGVVVRETVPDSVIERADEVELVDLPPDELLKRLKEGKVFVSDEAGRALERFFRKGNLLALRELALRRTADRVDAQALAYRRDAGVRDTWATTDRLLVAVGPSPRSADVVRAARRMAASLRAPWIALSVETPAFDRLKPADRDRVGSHLTLAERLGAETVVVRGEDAADEILAVARSRNVTRVVVGKPENGASRGKSLVDALIRSASGVEVLVTTGDPPTGKTGVHVLPVPKPPPAVLEYAFAASVVAAATAVCFVTRPWLGFADRVMIELLGVLCVAWRGRRRPAVFAAGLAVAATDFLFVEPYYTFSVADLRFVITFGVMLLTGLLVSGLTVRVREQAEAARERERRTAALYALSRDLLHAVTRRAVADVAAARIRDFFGTEARIMIAEGSRLAADESATSDGVAVAQWALDHAKPAGYGTDTLPASDTLYLPLSGVRDPVGVLAIDLARRPTPLAPSQRRLLETIVAQTALALERVEWAEEAAASRASAEAERARGSLLAAVSHDLRTPLASIANAAEVLLHSEKEADRRRREELSTLIRDEARRLARLTQDLLDLTRIECGGAPPRKVETPVDEVVDAALGRLRRELSGRDVRRDLPADVLVVPIDPALVGEILFNFLENAAKYGPPASPIEVRARREGAWAAIEVADRGPGVPAEDRERIFERFYRTPDHGRTSGTGLGLAICRAAAKSHGGRVEVVPRDGGGSVFRVLLPLNGRDAAPTTP